MTRFILLLVLLVAAALANQSTTEPQESEFQKEILKFFNKTNESLNWLTRRAYEQDDQMIILNATYYRLDQMAKNADRRISQVNEERKKDREQLEALVNLTERHIKSIQNRFVPYCKVARSSNLKLLLNGKMYLFSHQNKGNWNYANEICTEKNLHLAIIRNQKDAQEVVAEAKRIISSHSWWVSAKNQGSGGRKDFRWNDETKLELDSPLWWDEADKTQNCVRIYDWPNGKLNSLECTDFRPFICELPNECY
ncbi:uncharacterized protein LOC132196015 isoform X2 [Neocloeon triangulifer]|uniref:uncharacterized protein LOC132196015 isoform X2 n=1 Tax=Neocloeon triangulifer TaxID=2078957 RepID=UPI00286F6BD5|nr:uncharacterized protein LOC132196015 isoform X2 [Neocloeon triangulifer]